MNVETEKVIDWTTIRAFKPFIEILSEFVQDGSRIRGQSWSSTCTESRGIVLASLKM